MSILHESGGGHSVTVKEGDHASGSNRADIYVGSSDSGSHCHAWVDKSGDYGIVHRGECDECGGSSGGK